MGKRDTCEEHRVVGSSGDCKMGMTGGGGRDGKGTHNKNAFPFSALPSWGQAPGLGGVQGPELGPGLAMKQGRNGAGGEGGRAGELHTLHHQPALRCSPHPGARLIGRADIDAGVLDRHV